MLFLERYVINVGPPDLAVELDNEEEDIARQHDIGGAWEVDCLGIEVIAHMRSANAWGPYGFIGLRGAIILLLIFFGLILCSSPVADAGYLDLLWDAPTTRVDGTPLDPATELAGYRVYFGTASTAQTAPPCNTSAVVIGITTDYHLSSLADGETYFVQLTAIDTNGLEGLCSNEASAAAHPGENGASIASSDVGGGGGNCFIPLCQYE